MDYKKSILSAKFRISLRGRISSNVCALVWALGQFGLLIEGASLNQLSSSDEHDSISGGNDSSNNTYTYSISAVLISIGIVVSLILVISLCSGGCWPFNKIFRDRQPEYTGGFSNLITNSSAISQIDVNALQLDPVVFEPLPTLNNLSPQGGRFRQTVFDTPGAAQVGAIVPFTTDETNIYAHDWFDEPFRNFPRGNLEYFKEVGRGWFGLVIQAEARDIVPYAQKIKSIVKVLREDASGLEQMRFLDESRLYRESDHGNVLKLLGHSIEMSPFLLIMEYCPQGNLKSFLISNVTRVEMLNLNGDVIRMALDIAKGLEWMAFAGFTHGDLAARNCQVGSEGRIIIGDYGLATQTFKDDYYWSSNIAIPLRWAAPETLHCTINTIQTLKVTKVSNVWTFGICIWEICEFGKLPYFELTDDEVIARVISAKNYVLGHPTMPSLCMRDTMFEIMKVCWSPIAENRPSMSEIVRRLESALQELQATRRSKNEFDSKWEQLEAAGFSSNTSGKSPIQNNIRFLKSPNEVGKRKSVSFFGETISSQRDQLNSSNAVSNAAQDSLERDSWKVELFPQKTAAEIVLPEFNDPEEEHWRKRIERGDISQKVREKSRSAQDLMILTHVEPSELCDPESFISVHKQQPNNIMFQETGISSIHQSPILRKSSSETALNSSPVFSSSTVSSHSVILGNSSIIPPNVTRRPNTSTPKNSPRISINLIKPTPSPGVEINIIEPTPSPRVAINIVQPTPSPTDNSGSTTPNSCGRGDSTMRKQITVENIKKRFRFIFEENDSVKPVERHPVRYTSIPLRKPSPSKENELDTESFEDSDVFELPSEEIKSPGTMDESCPISPISKQSSELFNSKCDTGSMENYSILLGASDDLGLKPYQSVTTEMEDRSIAYERIAKPTEEQTPKKMFDGLSSDSKIFDSILESGVKVSVVNSNNSDSMENVMVRRKLFTKDTSKTKTSVSVSKADGSKILESGTSVPVMEVASDNVDNSTRPAQEGQNGDGSRTLDGIDDFWSEQIRSVKEATGNTLALFQLGLDEGDESSKNEVARRNIKFVEDIEAANNESESLILHDLEDEKCKQTKIGREVPGIEDPLMASTSRMSCTAFGGSVKKGKQFQPESEFKSPNSTGEENEFMNFTFNNSIEVAKNSSKLARQKAEDDKESVHTDSDGEEDLCSEFVPSTWNQNLIPPKPSIKSPEIVEGPDKIEPPTNPVKCSSGMRKSVSFERKKTQLVYEYPPQVVSDSDEEDGKQAFGFGGPIALALDWELQPDELEDAQFNNEDWEEDDARPVKAGSYKPEDIYKISGPDENFQVQGSSQPFVFAPLPTSNSSQSTIPPLGSSPSTSLGGLRHTRDKLKLDLSRGEASVLDEETKNPKKLDSGVGSSTSTNMSPLSHCDN